MKYENAAKFKFVLEPRYFYFGWSKTPVIQGRPAVLKALVKARSFLPKGYNFKLWDLQRPLSVQLAMMASFTRRFRSQNPKMSKKEIYEMVRKFAAKPAKVVVRPDTHRNGGAVDLTIIDKNGEELYMGTDHDDLTGKAATDYFEKMKNPSAAAREAKKNRRLLRKVMLAAGFENYAPEWWHWSYDK
jgi:D-alanyl-D-alanine dipeptidase